MKKIFFILMFCVIFSFNSFGLTNAPTITPTPTPTPNIALILGDMNNDGRVTSTDIAILNGITIGSILITKMYLKCGDLNSDSRISSTDVSILTRRLLNPPCIDTPNPNFSLVKSNNQFALNIFKEINTNNTSKNVFISPLSISMALSMLYEGSNNSTKTELSNMLGYDTTLSDLNSQYKSLLSNLIKQNSSVSLNIANSIWVNKNYSIDTNSDYMKTSKEVFNSDITSLDFNDITSLDKINEWISNKTMSKIPKMLNNPIYDQTMLLANAIYFKSDWKYQFVKNATKTEKFYKDDGSTNTIDMMSYDPQKPILFGNGTDFKVLKMPYSDELTSMYCILPISQTVDSLMNNMTLEKFEEIKSSIKTRTNLNVKIPKFKIDPETKSLKNSLIALGMKDSFDPKKSDFSLIGKDLYVSDVVHNATIEVDESGSVAAAATVVLWATLSSNAPIPDSFVANSPFGYFIVDDKTGEILFMGKSADLKN